MELKFNIEICTDTSRSSFNRTFMELKSRIQSAKGLSLLGFNRTFMELKSPWYRAEDNW